MRFFKKKYFPILLVAIVAALLAWNWRASDPQILTSLRDLTFDTYQRIKPRQPLGQPIRIIDIDEASIANFGQWPWPRAQIAQITDRLRELGAATLAFDMVFSEPDRTGRTELLEQFRQSNLPDADVLETIISKMPDSDVILAEAIARQPTVLGFFNETRSNMGLPELKAGYAFLGADPKPVLPRIVSSVMSLPVLQNAAAGNGSITLSEQTDDVVRRVPMFTTDGQNIYPALAVEALRVAQGAGSYVLKTSAASGEINAGSLAMTEFKVGQLTAPVDANGEMLLYFSRYDPELFLSAKDLLLGNERDILPLVEGHIVFVGASAAGLRDIRITPLGESVPGVFMHAQIADQILSGAFLNRPDWAGGAEIAAMLLITIMVVTVLPFIGAVWSALFGAVMSIVAMAVSWIAFSQYGILLDPLFPMLSGAAIFLMTNILLFAFAEREKRFVRGAFQRYLAPDLLAKLEDNPESLKLGGEIRPLTLMFMDVRGFTPISENLTPEELVTFLNKLLSPLSEVILSHEGAIDKYIGDSIMAFWNAPLDVEDHERKAARAALGMMAELRRLNEENAFGFHEAPLELGDVQIGIGINSGQGCVGNMGSTSRFDYSVVGDTVNVAARIESSCKGVGWPILLSESTAAACEDFALLEAGSISLKGKSRPARLFALVGDETLKETGEWAALSARHAKLIAAMPQGDIKTVQNLKNECIALAPAALAEFYEILIANRAVPQAAE